MRVLVLQQPASSSPFEQWLADPSQRSEISVITSSGTVREAGAVAAGVPRIVVDGPYEGPEVTAELFRQCARWKPDRIFSNSEDDVLRAAAARSLFGVPGTDSRTALAFRDKVAMKRLFAAARLECAAFAPVACVEDLLEARREYGEAVLKPRLGAAAVGVHVLRSDGDVLDLLHAQPAVAVSLSEGALMLEQRMAGDVFHVDALIDGPELLFASVSGYPTPPHLFRTHNVASVMFDHDEPESLALRELTARFTRSLPAGHGVNVLHFEFYRTGALEFAAGEVAARLGGGMIKNGIRHTYGFDMTEAACRLCRGAAAAIPRGPRRGPLTAFVLETARRAVPADRTPAWLLAHEDGPGAAAGASARDSCDGGKTLIEGGSRAELAARLAEIYPDCAVEVAA